VSRLAASVALVLALAGAALGVDSRALEQRANAFYDRLARGDRAGAQSAFAALERDLAAGVESLRDAMDAEREALVERDGDLETLYRSPAWRQDEIASLTLGYHLAWVRYQGAQLTDDAAKKKALLRKAVDSFGEFTAMSEVPEVYAESLYGRGLAYLDLARYGDATADLEAAAKLPRTRVKATAALAEVKRRASGGKAPAAPDPEQQLERLRTMLLAARDAPAKGLEAMEMARSLAVQGADWPAKVSVVVRDALGGSAEALPRSSYGLAVLGQLAVDRNRCGDLPALVAAGESVRDAGRERWRPDLLFLHAACVLNAGKPAEAAGIFATIARDFPSSARAEEAAYYRCRALDVARHDDQTQAAAYEPALRAFLERHPKSGRAAEIRFLLAELLRERDDCATATPLYEQVTAGPFATRSRLAVLECRVASLGPEADAERAAALDALRKFIASAPKDADERTLAKAHLLAALLAARVKPPDDTSVVALLDRYEERFPKETEWHATARRVRLEARLRAGQFAEADADVDALLAAAGDPATRKFAARVGRDLMRGGAKADDEASRQKAALARKIWRALAADGQDPQDRIALAELELAAGNAAEARTLFEAALAAQPDSAQARRGAARAAAALGDRDAAMAHWRTVVESSTSGGTSWYEARLAQFDLLIAAGHRAEACDLARRAAGQAKTTGGDVLAQQLAERAAAACH
jgi:tetratricopeptide (TPR) repeat protein